MFEGYEFDEVLGTPRPMHSSAQQESAIDLLGEAPEGDEDYSFCPGVSDLRSGPNLLSLSRIPVALRMRTAIKEDRWAEVLAEGAYLAVADYADGKLKRYLDDEQHQNRFSAYMRRHFPDPGNHNGIVYDPGADRVSAAIVGYALMQKDVLPKDMATPFLLEELGTLAAAAIIVVRSGDVRKIQPNMVGKTGAALVQLSTPVLAKSKSAPEQAAKKLDVLGKSMLVAGIMVGGLGRALLMKAKKTTGFLQPTALPNPGS